MSQSGAVATPVSATMAPRTPALFARTDDDLPTAPLTVERARYDVTIDGLSARTRATLVFRNHLPRVLDGELVFPLPEGALVSGFALDVDGRLVDGVVVEAHAARIAFETEARRRIDPGLVEWVRGDTFRTRVFPIPANGRRTIALEYITDLSIRQANGARAAIYELPLRYPSPIDELTLRIEAPAAERAPAVQWDDETITFTPWRTRYVSEVTRRQAAPRDDLRILLPTVPRDTVVVETNARGETYFAVDHIPSSPAPPAPSKPARIAVAWDASYSRLGADRERDLRLLAAHVRRLGDLEVDAIVFRNVVDETRTFAIRNGDSADLVAWLREQPCDGATNLAALRLPDAVGYTLLFSDGLSTLGGPVASIATRPIYALSGAVEADHLRLRALAEESGGAYVNLQRHSDADALDRLGRPVFSLLAVDADAAAIADLEPGGVQPIVGGRVRITGRLLADEARLVLRVGAPDAPGGARTAHEVVLRRPAASAAPQSFAGQLWAQQRMAALARDAESHRAALTQLGRRFSIVTPGTSLLVLETLDQYLAHGVTPPESLPEMRAAYLAARAADDRIAKPADKTERVVEMWRQRVREWERPYPEPRAGKADRDERARAAPGREVSGGRLPTETLAPEGLARRLEPMAPSAATPLVTDTSVTVFAPPPLLQTSRVAVSSTTGEAVTGPRIVVRPWTPDAPYADSLRRAPAADVYRRYLAERSVYGGAPSFYLECADLLADHGQRALAFRVLTTVAEMRLEDSRLLRVLAHRLVQWREHDRAVELFSRVLELRPEEPQSYRDLADALDARATARAEGGDRMSTASVADARRALSLLADIVTREWDGRFPDVETLALVEANRVAARLERAGAAVDWPLDPRLRRTLDFDVRVVLTWDTDDTDMDLWVTEPGGERCLYSHPLTAAGGRLSRDFTGGYGPEEYTMRRAPAGDYRISANFYTSRAQSLTGPTLVQLTIVTDYGRPTEQRRGVTRRLTEHDDVVEIGAVTMKGKLRVGGESGAGGQ